VIISTNGTNWSFYQTFGTGFGPWTNFESVAYANGLFVAVGDFGAAATSADGTNWATHATPTFSPLSAIAYGNGVWVAAGPRVSDGSSADTGGPGSPSLLAKHALLLAVGAKYRRLRSSMLIAIERGREPAVDFLNGEVVRAGKALGVPTPVNRRVQEYIHDIARRERRPAVALLRALYDETRTAANAAIEQHAAL
jgi:hypothetical protein